MSPQFLGQFRAPVNHRPDPFLGSHFSSEVLAFALALSSPASLPLCFFRAAVTALRFNENSLPFPLKIKREKSQ
jgi:hypothetical protein